MLGMDWVPKLRHQAATASGASPAALEKKSPGVPAASEAESSGAGKRGRQGRRQGPDTIEPVEEVDIQTKGFDDGESWGWAPTIGTGAEASGRRAAGAGRGGGYDEGSSAHARGRGRGAASEQSGDRGAAKGASNGASKQSGGRGAARGGYEDGSRTRGRGRGTASEQSGSWAAANGTSESQGASRSSGQGRSSASEEHSRGRSGRGRGSASEEHDRNQSGQGQSRNGRTAEVGSNEKMYAWGGGKAAAEAEPSSKSSPAVKKDGKAVNSEEPGKRTWERGTKASGRWEEAVGSKPSGSEKAAGKGAKSEAGSGQVWKGKLSDDVAAPAPPALEESQQPPRGSAPGRGRGQGDSSSSREGKRSWQPVQKPKEEKEAQKPANSSPPADEGFGRGRGSVSKDAKVISRVGGKGAGRWQPVGSRATEASQEKSSRGRGGKR